ncbi:MAG: hypothetical protein IJB33_01765 [Akkermansia sp.]|nr:hypothetical protein [Akkermansia sp.]
MNKFACIVLAASPAMIATAPAQEQKFTVQDYIRTQMALLNGMNELLALKHIAEDPGDVAKAINQLTQYGAALVSLKSSLNADELAAAQGNLEADPAAQAIGAAFINAVNALADQNFYGSNELATAVQNFAAVLGRM